MEGYFPENNVDHIDRDTTNNKWNNLRHVSKVCNSRNKDISVKNKSGITGVHWDKNKWRASITILNKKINLGTFTEKKDAIMARLNAEIDNGWHQCNNSSPALEYLKEA